MFPLPNRKNFLNPPLPPKKREFFFCFYRESLVVVSLTALVPISNLFYHSSKNYSQITLRFLLLKWKKEFEEAKQKYIENFLLAFNLISVTMEK